MDELSARLHCQQLSLSPSKLSKALRHFRSAARLLNSLTGELGHFFPAEEVKKIIGSSGADAQIDAFKRVLVEQQAELIAICDDAYPRLLREIPNPPALLYVRGDASKLNNPQIAIVGSRKMTPLGGKTARWFGKELAAAGLTVTSGLALGIDACAHQGALESVIPTAGSTIAVLGTGIEGRYPRRNSYLYQEIIDQGGILVSEYPPNTVPLPQNFPRRNRIITGLSMATLVVEASEKSGSIVSAKLAADQGRQVFAVPGSIASPASTGCHHLIREGAMLVTEPRQVIEDLCPMLELVLDAEDTPDKNILVEPTDHWLLKILGHESLSIDEICSRCERSVQEVTAAMTELELNGLVESGNFGYQRTGSLP